jgi:hypothetical protein
VPEIRDITWEENEAEHAANGRQMLEAVASGRKTARQVQEQNSIIPLDAKIEINWKEHSRRPECPARQSLNERRPAL